MRNPHGEIKYLGGVSLDNSEVSSGPNYGLLRHPNREITYLEGLPAPNDAGPNYGLLRAALNSGNTQYSEVLPISSNMLATDKRYTELIALFKTFLISNDTKTCMKVNKYLKTLNKTLEAKDKIKRLKCSELTPKRITRRYKRVLKLAEAANANDIAGWGVRRNSRRTSRKQRR